MRDDFLGPVWADNHRSTSVTIHKFFNRLANGFARLHAHQFDAPWRQSSGPHRA